MSQTPETTPSQRFRSLPPVAQWSARLTLDLPFSHFRDTVLASAATSHHRYTGFITQDPATRAVDSFTFTVSPRPKYGRPPIARTCARYMSRLATSLGAERVEKDPHRMPGFSRIILGLYEGQHARGERTGQPEHTVEELRARLGGTALVTAGSIFTTRPDKNRGLSYYTEPVGIILTPTANKQVVYDLAEATGQERFTVEDFAREGNVTYMMETIHCEASDIR